jgi:calcium-dependent protein kinase
MFTDAGDLKHIDFGLACKFKDPEGAICTLADKIGTLYSMSSQCLAESHDHRCDVWSIGVVAYLLLSGKQPFWGNERPMPWQERRLEISALIEKCEFSPMNGAAWYNVSSSAKAFVRFLMQLEADEIPTVKEALESE